MGGHARRPDEVVLVSPLLLGRRADLVPGDPDVLGRFDPERWRQDGPDRGRGCPSAPAHTPVPDAPSGSAS